jgi:hypothetical protein
VTDRLVTAISIKPRYDAERSDTQAPSQQPIPGGAVARDVNMQVIVVGPPGAGKTTLIKQLAYQWLSRGGWLFVHDLSGDYAPLARRYESAAAWRAAARATAKGGKPLARGARFDTASPTEMTELVIAIGNERNRSRSVHVPMMIVYDESAFLGDSGASYSAPLDVQLVARRRHLGVVPVYNLQDPTMLTARFWKYATDIFAFRQTNQRDIEQLDHRAGAPVGTFAPMLNAPPHVYLHYNRERGIVPRNDNQPMLASGRKLLAAGGGA